MKKSNLVFLCLILVCHECFGAANPGGYLVAVGDCGSDSLNRTLDQVVSHSSNVVATSLRVACSGLLLDANGTVKAWGYENTKMVEELNRLTGVTAVAVGSSHCLALKKDGTVVVYGDAHFDKTTVPAGVTNVSAIAAAGWENCVALKRDGSVVGWGMTKVPAGLANVGAISLSSSWNGRNLVLKRDGTVLQWINQARAEPVAGLSNIVAISAGAVHSLALRSDGTVAAWGYNGNGQTTVPDGLTNVVAIAAGGYANPGMRGSGFSLALKSDGTVVGWGWWKDKAGIVPAGLTDVVAISAADAAWVAITTNRAVAEKFRR